MKKIVGIILFIVFLSPPANATHGSHVEISYRWKSDSTYEFTVWTYRRCGVVNIPPPSSLSLRAKSSSLSRSVNFILFLDTLFSNDPAIVYHSEAFDCGDPDTIATCRKSFVYRANWTCPGRANDWIIDYEECCRIGGRNDVPPYGVENLDYQPFHIEINLNTLDLAPPIAQNRSPIWHNLVPHIPGYLTDTVRNYPVNTLCQNMTYHLDHSAREYDGDSVVYSFFHPQGNSGDTVQYRFFYSFGNPMPTIGNPVSIDAQTGMITITPSSPVESGSFTLGVQADEFRNGIHLGYVRRELSFIITDSIGTGMNKKEESGVKFYPNPSTGVVHFSNYDEKPLEVRIYNLSGHLIYKINRDERLFEIELKGLAPSLYVVEIGEVGSSFISRDLLMLR